MSDRAPTIDTRNLSNSSARWHALRKVGCASPLALLLAIASCGGGGGSTPAISVSFSVASLTVAEGSGSHDLDVQLHSTSGPLTVDSTILVSDIGIGGAASGSDYTAFAPTLLTFPAGSVDGAVSSVSIDVLDDALVEAPERVTLEISVATGEAVASGPTRAFLEIADDEPKTAPFAFVTDEGGNLTSSNQLFTLPATSVGAVSSSMRLTVKNLGPSEFAWRAPVLVGDGAGEFLIELVEVDGVPLPVPLPVSTSTGPTLAELPMAIVTPFLRTSADLAAPGALVPDVDALVALAKRTHVRLTGFPWPRREGAPEGELELELTALPNPFSADAQVLVAGQAIDIQASLAGNSLWTGHVAGQPLSRVFLALSPHGSRGWVQLSPFAPRLHLLAEPASSSAAAPGRLVFEDALPEGLRRFDLPRCATSLHVPAASKSPSPESAPDLAESQTPQVAALPTPGWVPGTVRLALETDTDFYAKFGSTPATTTYVQQLVASVAELFERHVMTRFEIVHLAFYPTNDPWLSPEMGGDTLDLLDEFRAAYAPVLGGSWPVVADLGHLLSGKSLGGGVAYVDVIGNLNFAFAVSADLTGSINWGTFTGAPDPLIWDYAVFSHELGHGFGSDHTHEYCPPIDRCYAGCELNTVCSRSTLMSYCHLCPTGLAAVDPSFHALTSNEMRRLLPTSLPTPTIGQGVELVYQVRFTPYVTTGVRAARIDFSHTAPNLPKPFRVRLEATAQ